MTKPDLATFQKLFKYNFPVEEHWKYYAETLASHPKYFELPSLLEEYLKINNPKSLYYKSIDEIIDLIKNTPAYNQFNLINVNKKTKSKKDTRNCSNKNWFVSFDMNQANYSTIKTFSSGKNRWPDSWDQFLKNNKKKIPSVPELYYKSKSLRQVIFGQINGKKISTYQKQLIGKLLDNLTTNSVIIKAATVSYFNHDEIVWQADNYNEAKKLAKELLYFTDNNIINVNMKIKIYELKNLIKKYKIRKIYSSSGDFVFEELFGVPGNKFFKYFKSFILKEDIFDERDLMFTLDGEIAKWVT